MASTRKREGTVGGGGGGRGRAKASARDVRNRFKKPKPLDPQLLFDESVAAETAESVARAVVAQIVEQGAQILFQHHIEARAVQVTAEQTVENIFQALELHLLKHDLGETTEDLPTLQRKQQELVAVAPERQQQERDDKQHQQHEGEDGWIVPDTAASSSASRRHAWGPEEDGGGDADAHDARDDAGDGLVVAQFDYSSVFAKLPMFLDQPTAHFQNWECEEEPAPCEEDRCAGDFVAYGAAVAELMWLICQ